MYEDGEGSGGEDASVGAAGGGRAGATINIARGRQTVARLVPVGTGERELGFGGYQLPDTFFDELPGAGGQTDDRVGAEAGAGRI